MNPAISLGTDDRLYVVWQDNRRGNWDIYGWTSADGTSWSVEQQIADSDNDQNYNQINPALAVDSQFPNHAYVVWQDDRAGNHDKPQKGKDNNNGGRKDKKLNFASGLPALRGSMTLRHTQTKFRSG